MVMKLRSAEEEKKACDKAWESSVGKKATHAWHAHHEVLAERVYSGGAKQRADYIFSVKPQKEKALRLRLFRPVRNQKALNAAIEKRAHSWTAGRSYSKLLTEYKKKMAALHEKECDKDCPWNGRTIFAKPKKVVKKALPKKTAPKIVARKKASAPAKRRQAN